MPLLQPSITRLGNGDDIYALAGSGGGGGGVIQSVSTITFNSDGGIYLLNNSSNASVNAGIFGYTNSSNTSTSELSITYPSGYSNDLTGVGGLWAIVNIDNAGQYYGDFGAGSFVVLGNNTGTTSNLPKLTADVNGDLIVKSEGSINLSTTTVLINGVPLGAAASVAITPSNIYNTVPAGGAQVILGTTPALVSNDWYRLDATFRVQTSNVPNATDWIEYGFVGNFNSYANNATMALSYVSSLSGNVYQNVSITAKADNPNPATIIAFGSLTNANATTVGVEVPMVLTHLGSF